MYQPAPGNLDWYWYWTENIFLCLISDLSIQTAEIQQKNPETNLLSTLDLGKVARRPSVMDSGCLPPATLMYTPAPLHWPEGRVTGQDPASKQKLRIGNRYFPHRQGVGERWENSGASYRNASSNSAVHCYALPFPTQN